MRTTCRQCRALLPGYIQRELTPEQRERVSRHLTACADCYVAYVEQRDMIRELAISLPRVGSDQPRLDRIRAGVMAELAHPKPPPHRYPTRYGLVALALVMALLLPMTFHSYAAELPTQPRPETVTPQGTGAAATPTETVTLTATLQSNYAPAPGATDTP